MGRNQNRNRQSDLRFSAGAWRPARIRVFFEKKSGSEDVCRYFAEKNARFDC